VTRVVSTAMPTAAIVVLVAMATSTMSSSISGCDSTTMKEVVVIWVRS